MEEVDGETAGFEVIAEDIGIIVLLGGGDALLLLQLVNRGELIAEPGGGFELFRMGSCRHARGQGALQLRLASFEKKLRVAHGVPVGLGRGESFDTRSQAAVNVVLQAGAGMKTRQVHLATGEQEAAMDQFDDPVGQIAGKVRAVVSGSVLAQAPGYEDLGKAVLRGSV